MEDYTLRHVENIAEFLGAAAIIWGGLFLYAVLVP